MKVKTQRKLLQATTGGLLVLGSGFLVWTISEPNTLPMTQSKKQRFEALQTIPSPTLSQLAPLLKTPLQAALVPPTPVKEIVKSQPKRVKWPVITLDCIFYGQSKLAVFSANNQTYTCSEGDAVLGITIEKINEDGIEATYQGERQTFLADQDGDLHP